MGFELGSREITGRKGLLGLNKYGTIYGIKKNVETAFYEGSLKRVAFYVSALLFLIYF